MHRASFEMCGDSANAYKNRLFMRCHSVDTTCMYVYFIQTWTDRVRIKVGKANDPARRLKELQTGSPIKLEMLGTIRCNDSAHAYRVEKYIHHEFRHCRRRGEWFDVSKSNLITMKRLIAKSAVLHHDTDEDNERAAEINSALDREWRSIVGNG